MDIRTTLKKRWTVIVITGLALVLFFEAQYFIHSVQSFYSQGELRPVYRRHETETVPVASPAQQATIATTRSVTVTETPDVDTIRLWMTFDYINVVFRLPNDYLKQILGINDPQYPNVRLDTYAKRSSISPEVLLNTVQQYTASYINNH